MKVAESILGGLAGSVVLNILHQALVSIDEDAPRMDIVGK